jgi:hypothetical protein
MYTHRGARPVTRTATSIPASRVHSPVARGSAVPPRIARTLTEDLSVDSPLKDEENGGVTTPTDVERDAFDKLDSMNAQTGLTPEDTLDGNPANDDPSNVPDEN